MTLTQRCTVVGLACLLAWPVAAGDRHDHRDGGHRVGGRVFHDVDRAHYRHWRGHRDRDYRRYSHRRHRHDHHLRGDAAAYLVGGVVLGALVNELAGDHRDDSTQTVIYRRDYGPRTAVVERSTTVTTTRRPAMKTFLRDRDGRCYEVSYRLDRKVLTEVAAQRCY